MKILLSTLLSLLFLGQVASAQYFTWFGTAPSYNWSGLYVGLNLGYGWGSAHADTEVLNNSVNSYFTAHEVVQLNALGRRRFHPAAFTGGVLAGYNIQPRFYCWVIGLETDFESLGFKKSHPTTAQLIDSPGASFRLDREIKTYWLYTLRARIGYSWRSWLPFITAGLAVINAKLEQTYSDNFNTVFRLSNVNAKEHDSIRRSLPGWTAGAGLEYPLPLCLSASLTYLHVHCGHLKSTKQLITNTTLGIFSNEFDNEGRVSANIVRFALNWKI